MLRYALLPLLCLCACASTPKGSVGRCPGSNMTACLTTEDCSYNESGNCMRCICQDAFIPDDRSPPPNQAPFQR